MSMMSSSSSLSKSRTDEPLPSSTTSSSGFQYPKVSLVSASFNITFLLLLGTTAATIIGALYPGAHQNPENRILADILIVESVVNFIATYFYSLFIKDAQDGAVQEKQVVMYRYMDWALTTPFLLLAIIMYSHYLNKKEDATREWTWLPVALPIILNWGMLYAGFLGETGRISSNMGLAIGFAFFFALLGLFWYNFVETTASVQLFWYLTISWGLYGVMYVLPDNQKTIGYNLLDLVSKVGFSMFTLGTIFTNNQQSPP